MSESIAVLQEKVDVLTKLLESEREEKAELKRETDELLAAKESLELERKSLIAERDELVNNLKAARRAREELEEAVASATKRNALGLDTIRKNVIDHVDDLDIWKVFLEQDRNYKHVSAEVVHSIPPPTPFASALLEVFLRLIYSLMKAMWKRRILPSK